MWCSHSKKNKVCIATFKLARNLKVIENMGFTVT